MSAGVWIALTAVAVVLAFGAFRMWSDGRFGSRPVRAEPDDGGEARMETTWTALAEAARATPGERATLVQFSSAFCAPCRATRSVLTGVAERVPGVVHVEIDAEQHLDLVRRLDVRRTPTTLVLDGTGREVVRAAGAPRTDQVVAALPLAISGSET